MSSALSVRGVGHSYGSERVLNDIEFEVSWGRSLALLGPSGSGKSTLLAIIGLLIRPETGRISLDGQCLSGRVSENRRHFAWVFQKGNALMARSVLDNVASGPLAHGVRTAESLSRANQAIDRVGLSHRTHARAGTLSGGELQRLSIARAVATSPNVLLADEPTGQLDSATSVSIARFLLDEADNRITVIATHDHELADRCDYRINLTDQSGITSADDRP